MCVCVCALSSHTHISSLYSTNLCPTPALSCAGIYFRPPLFIWFFILFVFRHLVIIFIDFLFHLLSLTACLQVSSGVSAIFGPSDALLGNHIQSVCDALDIPHLEARLELEQQEREVSINLYPPPSLIGDALRDLIRYLNWTRVAVIYEDDMCELKRRQLFLDFGFALSTIVRCF